MVTVIIDDFLVGSINLYGNIGHDVMTLIDVR
jgi:hypothetical protein